jgi:CheY-like chemotaxis protein
VHHFAGWPTQWGGEFAARLCAGQGDAPPVAPGAAKTLLARLLPCCGDGTWGNWIAAGGPMLNEILLIDDDPGDTLLHRRVITGCNAARSIIEKRSVDDAIRYLAQPQGARPELILLDVQLPPKSGWDFLREFQCLPLAARQLTAVVMLTSCGDPANRRQGSESGMLVDYLVKPLTREALLAVLEKHFPDSAPTN